MGVCVGGRVAEGDVTVPTFLTHRILAGLSQLCIAPYVLHLLYSLSLGYVCISRVMCG